MRLTLRTLLAYLDDTLEPAQAKLIGQKVAESPAAQELIARVKDVVRRRRLTTPPPGGISDPNTIAEYIDSELPAERLAEVEEACLSSDVHLAEIAACHQILTVVLSEPILVPPTAKRRMYMLRRGPEANARRRAAAREALDAEQEAAPEAPDATDDALLLGLPLYPRRGSLLRRLAPILGVVVLAGALVAVIAISLTNLAPPSQTSRSPSDAENRVAVVPKPEADNTTKGQPENTGTKTHPAGTVAVPPQKTDPAKGNDHAASGASNAGGENPATDANHSASPSTGATAPPRQPVEAKPGPGAGQEVGHYIAEAKPHSVLYQHPAAGDRWQRVHGLQSPVQSACAYLSLPGYRSEIDMAGGVRLSLWGTVPDPNRLVPIAESQVVLNHDPAFDLDLTLQRGRVAITKHKADPARLRLRFEREVWDVTLTDPDSEIIVERWGVFPPGVSYTKGALDDGPAIGTALVVSHGSCELKTGYFVQRMHAPPGPALFLWDNTGGAQTTPHRLEKLQSWFLKTGYPAQDAQILEDLSTRLEQEDPVMVLPQLVKGDKLFARRVAVHALAAIDDLSDVIDALTDENHRDVRLEAVNALRHWMALEKGNAEKLHTALLRKFQSTGAIVNDLLYTYSIEQLNDPSTWELLIAYLKHPNLAVRELADDQLTLLLPELHAQVPYDPAASAEQRNVAVAMWKRLIPPGHLPPQTRQSSAPAGAGKTPQPRERRRP